VRPETGKSYRKTRTCELGVGRSGKRTIPRHRWFQEINASISPASPEEVTFLEGRSGALIQQPVSTSIRHQTPSTGRRGRYFHDQPGRRPGRCTICRRCHRSLPDQGRRQVHPAHSTLARTSIASIVWRDTLPAIGASFARTMQR
jgi:hypothetical protein